MAKLVINEDKIRESYIAFNDNLENIENEAVADARVVASSRGLNADQTNRLCDLMKAFKRETVKETYDFYEKMLEMGFMEFQVESDEPVEAINEDGEVVNFDPNGDEYNG